jgi:hypothetical protein
MESIGGYNGAGKPHANDFAFAANNNQNPIAYYYCNVAPW